MFEWLTRFRKTAAVVEPTDVQVSTTAKAEETGMLSFVTILGYALGLLPTIVTGIQTVVGDSQSGATKKQMAQDALAAALQGASSVLTPGSTNAALAGVSGAVAGQVIDTTSAIADVISHLTKHDAVSSAVNLTKATGAYQAATAASKAVAVPSVTLLPGIPGIPVAAKA